MKYIDTDSPLRLGRISPDGPVIEKAVKKLKAGEGFQLECDGKVVGAVISPRDLELYLQLLREYEDKRDIEAAEAAKAEGGTPIPLAELLKEFGIATEASTPSRT